MQESGDRLVLFQHRGRDHNTSFRPDDEFGNDIICRTLLDQRELHPSLSNNDAHIPTIYFCSQRLFTLFRSFGPDDPCNARQSVRTRQVPRPRALVSLLRNSVKPPQNLRPLSSSTGETGYMATNGRRSSYLLIPTLASPLPGAFRQTLQSACEPQMTCVQNQEPTCGGGECGAVKNS